MLAWFEVGVGRGDGGHGGEVYVDGLARTSKRVRHEVFGLKTAKLRAC